MRLFADYSQFPDSWVSFVHTCRPNMQDRERLETLITMAASDLATSVASSGHTYAMTAAASSLTPIAGLSELYFGLSQVSPTKATRVVVRLNMVLLMQAN